MNLPDVEAFVALAETGSVNRAALRLNLTQPAVTRRIQNFEASLGGAALLDRRAKPSVLTPDGYRALEGCRQILRAVADLKVFASPGHMSGEIRLGVAHGLAAPALGSPIDALAERFPSIRPRMSTHWSNWLIEQVRSGGLDCAIGLLTSEHSVPPGVGATAIGLEKVAVVAARDVVADQAGDGRLGLRDLSPNPWVLNPPGCGYRAALQRAFDVAGAPLRIVAEVLEHDLQLSLIARGLGLGLVPRRYLDRSPHRRRLRILKLDDFELDATVAILRGVPNGRLGPVIDFFQAEVTRTLKDDT